MGGIILALVAGVLGYKLAEHQHGDKHSRWNGTAWQERCDQRRADRAAFKEFMEQVRRLLMRPLTRQRYKQQSATQPPPTGLGFDRNEKDGFTQMRQDVEEVRRVLR